MLTKIKYKLLLWIFLSTIIIGLISIFAILSYTKDQAINNSTILVSNILEQTNKNIALRLKNANDTSLRLANNNILKNVLESDSISVLQHNQETLQVLSLFNQINLINSDLIIQIFDLNRNVVDSVGRLNRFSSNRSSSLINYDKLLKDKLYKDLLNDSSKSFIIGFFNNATWENNLDYISFIRFVKNDNNQNIGIIIASIKVDSFFNIYKDSVLVNNGDVYLIDKNGALLSSSDSDCRISEINKSNIDINDIKRFSTSENSSLWIKNNGKTFYLSVIHNSEFSYFLYTLQNQAGILSGYTMLKRITILIEIIRVLIITLFVLFIISYFTKPIEILTNYMGYFMINKQKKNIESEIIYELNKRIKSTTEIGILSTTFGELLYSQANLNREIINREKSKADLEKRSKDYLATIFNSLPSVIISIDSKFCITQWNSLAEKILKKSTLTVIGRDIWGEVPLLITFKDEIINIVNSSFKDTHFEAKNILWGDYYINISVSQLSSNISRGAIIRIDDVTEKVKIGELLIQSEKMLSVGGLAAGMAHEINNPLGGMMQNANVISNRLVTDLNMSGNINAAKEAGIDINGLKKFIELRNIPKLLENIQESGLLIRNIITNMLGFARKGGDITSLFSLEAILDKAIELSHTEISTDIIIIKNIGAEIPSIPCDAVKIQQVFLNILVNGAHALHTNNSLNPRIIIEMKISQDKKSIITIIEDNGPGMEEHVKKRVFEPFFTTKPVGLGTGLGLSVSYFIVTENHGGSLSVESTPNIGTKFIITLPIKSQTKL